MTPTWLAKLWLNFYPPYLGAGVRVKKISPDYRRIEVEMKLRFWNKNYVSTQFGGSLYSMTDPFYMFMLIQNLGRDYVVWDKGATIKFKSPGRGRVRTVFELSEERIQAIKHEADTQEKSHPVFQVTIVDDSGGIVAEIEKLVSVRHRSKVRQNKT